MVRRPGKLTTKVLPRPFSSSSRSSLCNAVASPRPIDDIFFFECSGPRQWSRASVGHHYADHAMPASSAPFDGCNDEASTQFKARNANPVRYPTTRDLSVCLTNMSRLAELRLLNAVSTNLEHTAVTTIGNIPHYSLDSFEYDAKYKSM